MGYYKKKIKMKRFDLVKNNVVLIHNISLALAEHLRDTDKGYMESEIVLTTKKEHKEGYCFGIKGVKHYDK
jgi:hypothetical protein